VTGGGVAPAVKHAMESEMRRIVTASLFLLVILAMPFVADGAPKNPASGDLTISATPKLLVYGQATTIAGKLKASPLRSNVPLRLEDNPAPFTRGFELVKTSTTDRNGDYSFAGIPPLLNTRYRTTAIAPRASSSELLVQVAIKVVLRLSDRTPRAGGRVRFFGTAAPQHDGRLVYIQRRTATGAWRTVARTALKDAGTELSQYSRRIRVRRDGTYRARVFHDSDHADGTSRTKSAAVH
jgi:thermitase